MQLVSSPGIINCPNADLSGNLTVSSSTVWSYSNSYLCNNITVSSSSTLYLDSNTLLQDITLNAANITIASDSAISSDGYGYVSDAGPGKGSTNGGSSGGGGGGHGGAGGNGNGGALGGSTYGSSTQPITLGSGGGSSYWTGQAGKGGGAMKLVVTGTLTNFGTISANGISPAGSSPVNGGAGSGGSIWINAGTMTGTGPISAVGGNAVSTGNNGTGGCGGGGRVSVSVFGINSFSGSIDTTGSCAVGNSGDLGTAYLFIATHTLTYTAGANGTLSGSSTQIVSPGSNGTAVTANPNTGYHFVNWSDASTSNPRTDMNVQNDTSVTANFAINTYTLSYAAGSHGSITGSTTQIVNYGSNGTSVTAVPDSDYKFVSWSDGATTTSRTDLNITNNLSVTASFVLNQRVLHYISGTNGTITGSTTQSVTIGTDGTQVTANPNTGYHFVSWSDGVLTASRTDTNVQNNITATSSYAINTYNLLYSPGANGTLSGSSTQTINYGNNGSSITAVPNTGYHFVSWSDGVLTASRQDMNVTGNISATVNFAINAFTLSYIAGSNGTLSGNTNQNVNYGSDGTSVTAIPDFGYGFSSWSDSSTTNPRTDTNITDNISVMANFNAVSIPRGRSIATSTEPTPCVGGTCACDSHGDINNDTKINLPDFSILMYFWEKLNPSNPCADINKDGAVNLKDFSTMLYWWTN